jgi:hypothetical protein
MPKKLTLNVEELAVTSFDPAPVQAEPRGTVEAHALAPSRNTACVTCRTMCAPYC